MTLKELSQRAVRIRQRYAEVESAQGKAPWSRSQLLQGFVVDLGELMELVMAKAGSRHVEALQARLAHELADCLWSVLVLADAHGIDPEASLLETMGEWEGRLGATAGPASTRQGRTELAELQERALSVRRPAPNHAARSGRECSQEQVMEGFVVEVGELMRQSIAAQGVRAAPEADPAVARVLSHCLWCVLVLSDLLAVSLEESFLQTMNSIETKIDRKARL